MLPEGFLDELKRRISDLGFELADVRVGGSRNRPLVVVRVDRPDSTPGHGITVDDCATVSRALEAWLDQAGPFGERYVLEVSSPGIERPLRWPEHWVRFVGHEVNIRAEGLGRLRATIVAVPDRETVVLRPKGAGAETTIRFAAIRDATLAHDW
jgi:ribosome maturation factor RimP